MRSYIEKLLEYFIFEYVWSFVKNTYEQGILIFTQMSFTKNNLQTVLLFLYNLSEQP